MFQNTPTKADACVSTEEPQTYDASTVTMDLTVMCAAYTQTQTRMDGDGGAAVAKEDHEHEIEIKNQRIRELEEELAVSKRLTADLMLNVNSVETQTETNNRKRNCANADEQESVRKLQDKNAMLSESLEQYYNLIVLNQEVEQVLRQQISDSYRIRKRYERENRALLRRVIELEDEIIGLKESGLPPTERATERTEECNDSSPFSGNSSGQWNEWNE